MLHRNSPPCEHRAAKEVSGSENATAAIDTVVMAKSISCVSEARSSKTHWPSVVGSNIVSSQVQ